MFLGEIGALLLFLAVIFVFGNLWFHFVEAVWSQVKKLLPHRKEPPAWHTLPSDKEDEKNG